MARKKIDLDDATVRIMRRMLEAPPKLHDEMKIGSLKEKKRGSKSRAASAKRRTS